MFKKFTINNFKRFRNFSIDNLNKINLITGQNSIGKTSILECIWFQQGPSNLGLFVRANNFRGYDGMALIQPLQEYFYNYKYDVPLTINSELDTGEKRGLTLIPTPPEQAETYFKHVNEGKKDAEKLINEPLSSQELDSSLLPVQLDVVSHFQRILNNEIIDETSSRVHLNRNKKEIKLQIETGKLNLPGSVFLYSKNLGHSAIGRFSNIAILKKKNIVIDALKIIEPRLVDIEVGLQGQLPQIFCDIGFEKQMPLFLLGEGFTKLFTIITSILESKNGSVLIDEFENGFYFDILEKAFKTIFDVAIESNTQLFITTHSKECIEAFYKASETDFRKDISVYNLYKKNGEIKTSYYNIDTLEGALQGGLEIR